MLDKQKSLIYYLICETHDAKNLVKKATCFTKIGKPSLLDVIITNEHTNTGKVCNFGSGISDCHNFISVQVDITILERQAKHRLCRSFKHFDAAKFAEDLDLAICLYLMMAGM